MSLTITVFGLLLLLHIFEIHKTGLFQKKKDLFVCSTVVLVYALYAFSNLGNTESPQSGFEGANREETVVDFGENVDIGRIQFMAGNHYGQLLGLEFSYDGEQWSRRYTFETMAVFAWHSHDFNVQTRFVRLITRRMNMLEMGFRDVYGNLITIASVEGAAVALFDEQHLVPMSRLGHMHSTYFDEIYYPRTAYEFIHGLDVYEWTHPPLGKIIISWGIQIFGMTPFGWRFMNVLSGILALIPLYFMAKALLKSSFWAGFATFIFAFDFMHFVQSRIATLDSFVLLFIVTMYYFMYEYTKTNFLRDKLIKTLFPLFLSGLFMGFAIATKWSGGFGAVGIAVIFFITIAKRYLEYRAEPEINKSFYKKTGITLACCVGFFIAVPAVIYVLSYIPFYAAGSLYPEIGFFESILQNQLMMVSFHLHLNATHPFSSYWWQWIINWRPMLFFDYLPAEGMTQNISTFGNPLVWWGGLPALAYTLYRAIRKNFDAIFLMIGYLSLFVPWLFASRLAFIYYYYPNVVFLALMIGYSIQNASVLDSIRLNRKTIACVFAGAVFLLFLLFYPVISGVTISISYVETFLRWPFMREWVLVFY